ncbi:hypothetical protein CHCC14557_2950 [Bacillus licheniformis]|nr:hypothetical protein CHCC14557_2950 [Bacillus licheniformis]
MRPRRKKSLGKGFFSFYFPFSSVGIWIREFDPVALGIFPSHFWIH